MKIAVYAIMHNEEKHIERFLEASLDADYIVLGDTGCTDATVAKAIDFMVDRDLGSKLIIQKITIKPWRFDMAREAVLAIVPEDADVCCSIDIDEIFQPGWRAMIEKYWTLGTTTRLHYMFDWGAGIAFWYEKIHARFGYKWKNPCHEFPVPYGIVESHAWVPQEFLMLIHKPDPSKERHGKYLPLLKMSVEEDPNDPRNAFYYARELYYDEQWEEAIRQVKRYLLLPNAMWPGERAYAHRVMGDAYERLGDQKSAQLAYLASIAEHPNSREAKYALANMAYKAQRWPECLSFALLCLDVKDREVAYTVDPSMWGFLPHLLASVAAFHLGIKPLAVEHGRLALEKNPDDVLLLQNMKFFEEMP
jgi:tetratricopeptide (TPR) repeat protein